MVGTSASSKASNSSSLTIIYFFVAMAPTSSTSFFYIGNTVSHSFVVSFILFFHSLSACSASKSFFGITKFPATMTLTTSSPQAKKPKIGNYAGYAMPPLNDQRATIGDLSPELLCQTCSGPTFSQGLDTFVVPMALHAWNRQKVVSSLTNRLENKRSGSSLNGESRHANSQIRGMILLEGGKQQTRHDTDHEPVFRQESYFHYLFGASLYSDCYGVITLPEGKTTLFVPTWGVDTETVCGPSPEFERVRAELGLDEVLGVGDLKGFVEGEMGRMREEWLAERKKKGMEVEGEDGSGNLEEKKENADIAGTNGENVGNNASNDGGEPKIYLLKGLNTDSGNFATPAYYKGIEDFATVRDESELFPCIAECRVIKTPAEINLMRYTNWISSMAHVEVMRACRPGMMEYQLESLFQHHTYTHGGCRHMSYTCICACGPSANILHYGHAGRPNSRLLAETDMALLDMGAEYHCYASDITCSFPVKGSFSDDQKSIYQAVLNAQIAVIDQLKPGVSWLDMHRVAEREILKGLVAMGILTTCGMELDAAIDEMLENDLGAIFMPHGLGHLIGIDTHDVGGYAEGTPPRSTRAGLKKCRTARIAEEGMVLTVEPGCYFIDPLMDMALADERQRKFVISERLNQFRGFGGVRLEDNVWVTKDGCENMTICPRSVDEVLDVMKGGVWPPVKDALPELKRKWIGCKGGKVEMLDIKP